MTRTGLGAFKAQQLLAERDTLYMDSTARGFSLLGSQSGVDGGFDLRVDHYVKCGAARLSFQGHRVAHDFLPCVYNNRHYRRSRSLLTLPFTALCYHWSQLVSGLR